MIKFCISFLPVKNANCDSLYRNRQAARTAEETSSTTVEVSDEKSDDVQPAAQVSNSNDTEPLAEKSEEMENLNSAEQANIEFPCDICDFKSNRANGLKIHMTRKHQRMEQLDGSNSISDDLEEDDKFCKTIQYWKEGKLGTIFQAYLDVLDIIDKSELTDKSKDDEKARVLEARKKAFGTDFEFYPPWSSK